MNKAQLAFLEQLGERIPRLFEAIAQGNVKSEFIIGVRTINGRQVRLKLVAEVADPGSNPLATHGQLQARSGRHDSSDALAPEGSGGLPAKVVEGSVQTLPGAGGDSGTEP